jgi:hypothetical protein
MHFQGSYATLPIGLSAVHVYQYSSLFYCELSIGSINSEPFEKFQNLQILNSSQIVYKKRLTARLQSSLKNVGELETALITVHGCLYTVSF